MNFVTCFTEAMLGEEASSPSNQLGFFCFCCPYFSGLHTSLFLMSYGVACLELPHAPCSLPSIQYKKRLIWRPTSGSACASLHKINIQSGAILYCFHTSLGGQRRGLAKQRYCMDTERCLGNLFRAFLHQGWFKPTSVVVLKLVFSR